MRKRTKLRKKVHTHPSISSKIMSIEQSICESHSKEKLYDETLAVTRIKSDTNFFFRYAKIFSMCTKAIGPLLHPVTHLLTDNKTEMCTILLDQFNSVFSTPKPGMTLNFLSPLLLNPSKNSPLTQQPVLMVSHLLC